MALPTLRSKKAAISAPKPAPPRNQTAAAALIGELDVGWKDFKFGSNTWQVEAWRHYDRCPELRAVGNTVASMASRCHLYIAKKINGEPGPRAEEPAIAELSNSIYGGADERPELIRLAVLNLFNAGEYFTFIEKPPKGADSDADRWMVLSVTQIKKGGGQPKIEFQRPHKYGSGTVAYWIPEGKDPAKDKARAKENTGVFIRSWTPHAQMPDHPDSSVRACLPVLNLIEQYDKRSSAQNDSRLAGAGVMFLPDSFDFPQGDHDSPTVAFEARLGDTMGETLKEPSNARSLVPIMATVDGQDIDKIKWLTFETPLDEQTKDRLAQCIHRLALGLDTPPELLEGVGDLNHWTAWQSEASTHKTFVAPPLARVCHSITEGWLQPLLKTMGKDPEEYMVWFDMSPLTVRPDRQADALLLWKEGLLNDQAVRKAGNWSEDDAHTPESYKTWLIVQAIRANPAFLADPNLAGQLGITGSAPQAALTSGAENQQPPAEPTDTRSPAQEALVAGAEMAAMHSLGVANKKLLGRHIRTDLMNEFQNRAFDLHTSPRVEVKDFDHAGALLDGTWDLLPQLATRTGTDQRILHDILAFYCASKLVSGAPHDSDTLTFYLSQGILAADHRFCADTHCVNKLNPQPCLAARSAVSA